MEKNRETSIRHLPCHLKIRLILPFFGILIGASVALVFSVRFQNYNVAAWGLASGIAAALALLVSIGSIKMWWDPNPRILKRFMLGGCLFQLAGICGFVAYLTLAITKHQGLIISGPGYYLTCIWCFMTWKWGFLLFYYSKSFLHSFGFDGLLTQGRKSSYASLTDDVQPPATAPPEPVTEEPATEEDNQDPQV